jgi:hypothetical protein
MHFDGLTVRHGKIALITEFGDGIGNGIVQTPVEGSKLVYQKWGIALEREVRGGPGNLDSRLGGIAGF